MVSPTSLATRLPSKLTVLLFCILLSACATQSRRFDGYSPVVKVFQDDFEKVWRASHIALQRYPMRVNNIDKGLLETDWIKGFDVYKPVQQEVSPAGLRYKITLRTIKGKINDGEAVKVAVQKKAEKRRDFFADSEKVPSDSIEEKVILYRIQREIQIDNALEIAQERGSSQESDFD